MTPGSMTDATVKAAIAAIESETATPVEKIEMLIEMATGMQKKPKSPQDLYNAVELYLRAIELCGDTYLLLRARAMTGLGTALRSIPDEGIELLIEARNLYNTALPLLQEHASPEEVAEAEMNLGLVLQSLAPHGKAKMAESIQAYQRALRVFTGDTYPQEFAILQNNIAIAYLSMPLATDRDELREGMAVQAFDLALRWITLIDHPSEYAMLQNNLGNALQYMHSSHPVENNYRAIAAYDEALKVRNAHDTPMEYANTIANKANALSNLPDDAEHPEAGNRSNLLRAQQYYREAEEILKQHGQLDQAATVTQALAQVEQELNALP